MKPKYEEFTVEDIESLANECDRLADENSRLPDLNDELIAFVVMVNDLMPSKSAADLIAKAKDAFPDRPFLA